METNQLIKELTLDEKIDMIHGDGLFKTKGVPRLGIPSLSFSDGPMGVRNDFENDSWKEIGLTYDYVTYHPSNSALTATWNLDLAYKFGLSLGTETRGRGKDIILAPGINIVRSPLCGRNFEYMSEDPLLIQQMVVPLIKGIQKNDVAACVKHFALNNQETNRLEVEVEVSEKALWELYLPGFYSAINEGNCYSLMGTYNKYKNEYCCESKILLNSILRGKWKYEGVVVSDWGGVHSTLSAVESGLDVEMDVTNNFDDYCFAKPLKEAVLNGTVKENLIDEKVRHVLGLMKNLNMFSHQNRKLGAYNSIESQTISLEVARESLVLLKNEDNLLPIKKKSNMKILLVGENANKIHSNGGGSSEIKALFEITPILGLHMLSGGDIEFDYEKGYESDSLINHDNNWQELSTQSDFMMNSTESNISKNYREKLRRQAVEKAKNFDVVIFVGGLNHTLDSEGVDRTTLNLPYEQNELISELLKVKPDSIITLVGGSAVAMPWIKDAKAVLWSWYAGARGGEAFAEVLFGKVNPSGKLPVTFPQSIEDCSANSLGTFPGEDSVSYDEDIYVGYRYNDTYDVTPLFPFGHGLSYTEFIGEVKSINILESSKLKMTVSVMISNTGRIEGKQTVQLYIRRSCIENGYKELQGFNKVELLPQNSTIINFDLSEKNFGNYNNGEFIVEAGEYEILLGYSSWDIFALEKVSIEKNYRYNLD